MTQLDVKRKRGICYVVERHGVTLLASRARQEVDSRKGVDHVETYADPRAADPPTLRVVPGGRAGRKRDTRLSTARTPNGVVQRVRRARAAINPMTYSGSV